MNIWEKIRQGFFDGAANISEKTAKLAKSGVDLLKEGTEKASAKTLYASKLAHLNSQERFAFKSMESHYKDLGELLFKLKSQCNLSGLEKEADNCFKELSLIETKIKKYQDEKNDLANFYKIETLEIESLKQLTADLEEGGGTILQAVIEEDSPFKGKYIKDIKLPKEVLLGTIVRGEDIIIPDGETIFQPGDKVAILGKHADVEKTIALMSPRENP